MNPEEIKKGDKVNLTLLVTDVVDFGGEKSITAELPTGRIFMIWQSDFEALSPAKGIKNAEPAPKYDPCRPFKAGDIVEPCQVKGRWQSPVWEGRSGILIIVTSDEEKDGTMWVKDPDCIEDDCVDAVYFQLVTPVEELEPYIMLENVPSNSIEVRDKRKNKVEATFYFGKDHAYTFEKAATRAEAERDRLNAEWKAAQNAELRKDVGE